MCLSMALCEWALSTEQAAQSQEYGMMLLNCTCICFSIGDWFCVDLDSDMFLCLLFFSKINNQLLGFADVER